MTIRVPPDLPAAGLAAGPCLFKDTMQLAAFNNNKFTLGHAEHDGERGSAALPRLADEARFDLSSMTVGILGMAFKAESDDTFEPLVQVETDLPLPGGERSYALIPMCHTTPNWFRSSEVLAEADVLVIGGAPPRLSQDRHDEVRSSISGTFSNRASSYDRVSVVIPVYNEGAGIAPCLDRVLEAVRLPCEVLVVYDTDDDTTLPYLDEYAGRSLASVRVRNAYGRGPATRSSSASTMPRSPVAVVTMADGSDDPMQIDQLTRLVERGVVVAAASRYARSGQQVGGPVLKGLLSRGGWAVALLPGTCRHPRRHQFVQGVLHQSSCDGWASRATRASRSASSSSPRLGGPVSPLPRYRRSGSTGHSVCRTSSSGRGCRAISIGIFSPSAQRPVLPGFNAMPIDLPRGEAS